jgi:hypothetical protein
MIKCINDNEKSSQRDDVMVMLLINIRGVLSLNLGRNTDYDN